VHPRPPPTIFSYGLFPYLNCIARFRSPRLLSLCFSRALACGCSFPSPFHVALGFLFPSSRRLSWRPPPSSSRNSLPFPPPVFQPLPTKSKSCFLPLLPPLLCPKCSPPTPRNVCRYFFGVFFFFFFFCSLACRLLVRTTVTLSNQRLFLHRTPFR